MQKALPERASAVRVTHRLTDSPACLVSDDHGMSTHLERLLKAAGQTVPNAKPILEINPSHPIVQRLKEETDEARFADWSHILFDQATLAEGGQLDDPGELRPSPQRADADARRRRPVADLDPRELSQVGRVGQAGQVAG